MKLKRFTGVIISIFMLAGCKNISAVTDNAHIYSDSLGENVTYTLNTDTGELVISGSGDMTDFKNNPTSYSPSPFCDSSDVKTVVIESGITGIGNYVFYGCSNLASISIPDTVTSIGGHAFFGDTSLTNITILSSVTEIGSCAFEGCGFTTAGPIGEGYDYEFGWTESIPGNAFSGLSFLTNVEIPDSITEIGKYAFSGDASLTNVTILSSVTEIGHCAFENCGFTTAGPIGGGCDYEFGWTESIPANAFSGLSSLTNVEIPDTITEIGICAFSSCSALTSISIPAGVTSIGNAAFESCSSLSDITIPSGVTDIGSGTFYECSALSSIDIPLGVTDIGDYAFYNCTSLASPEIPSSVTSVGMMAFASCSSPTFTNITIPAGLTNIGIMAFSYCRYLYINVEENNPAYTSVDGVLFDSEMTKIFLYSASSTNTSYEIPDSVTSIEDAAFCYCENLIEIIIPDSVTKIGDQAFSGCTGLTEITIPDSVTKIGYMIFLDCTGLTEITIPDSVTIIRSNAFSGSGLTTVYCYEGSSADDLSRYPDGVSIVYIDNSGTA